MIDQPPITCQVISVHDGDGPIHCANGISIRVAGIQAPDYTNTDPCKRGRAEYVCDDAAAERSRIITTTLTLHKTMTCQPVGMSYKRTVAICTLPDGRDLRCAIVGLGGAVDWPRYVRRYHLGACR